MSISEQFPKRCIKCKRSDVDVVPFLITKTKQFLSFFSRSTAYRTTYERVPVCEQCQAQFTRYLKFHKIVNLFKILLISFIFLLAIFSIVYLFINKFLSTSLIFLILSIGTMIIFIILYIKDSNHPDRISNYVSLKINGNGSILFIKDPYYRQEIANHITSTIVKEEIQKKFNINIIYCPKCGSKQKKGTDFCLVCGKELRRLYNV